MSQPLVGVIMGSDSDLPALKKGLERLREFGIVHEVRVASAHRSPQAVHDYVSTAEERGLKVMIAAAGRAAHLAGVVASLTTLPVIGVPMAGGPLQGQDALLATVQMPPGTPVATMAIGEAGAINAAILAAQIIALSDESLREKVKAFKAGLAAGVMEKNARVQEELGL